MEPRSAQDFDWGLMGIYHASSTFLCHKYSSGVCVCALCCSVTIILQCKFFFFFLFCVNTPLFGSQCNYGVTEPIAMTIMYCVQGSQWSGATQSVGRL